MVMCFFDFISAGVLPTMNEKLLTALLFLAVAAAAVAVRGLIDLRCRGPEEVRC